MLDAWATTTTKPGEVPGSAAVEQSLLPETLRVSASAFADSTQRSASGVSGMRFMARCRTGTVPTVRRS